MRESQIEAHLVKRVKQLGGEVRKVQFIGRRGAPDRLVMMPRRLEHLPCDGTDRHGARLTHAAMAVWVELKAPGQVPEPHQEREHQRMRAMGQRVEVIDSIEGVEELLK